METTIINLDETEESLYKKKTYGAFYTPEEITKALSDWALRDGSETVLEPSFGGCGFLKSLSERLQFQGAESINQIYSCDIDQQAF